MSYWYVIFVTTGQEQHIVSLFNKCFTNNNFRAFIPMREATFKRNGRISKEMKIMFPGYVFIETELCCNEFLKYFNHLHRTFNNIIKILKYGDSDEFAINEEERVYLERLINNDNYIETSVGFIEGDNICVEEGPLKGRESIIKRINRHKKEAIIDIKIMGEYRQITVGLEILRKI